MNIKRNQITVENGFTETHSDNIKNQLSMQFNKLDNSSSTNEIIENIKGHFKFVLAQDFYKNALTAEEITRMESYLPENYQDDYIN